MFLFRNKTAPGFFEAKYRKSSDPWNFEKSSYEQARYDRILKALAGRRFRRAYEPGCSVGVFTQRLAAICDQVDAADFSPTAAARAAERCSRLPNVAVSCAALTSETQLGGYDLIVLSEIGYYFKRDAWRSMVSGFAASMEPGATLLASHWLGHSRDHRMEGQEVHMVLKAELRLHLEHEEQSPELTIARFVRI